MNANMPTDVETKTPISRLTTSSQPELHARQRAKQRYGEEYDSRFKRAILSRVQTMRKARLLKITPSRIVWKVRYNQRTFIVVTNSEMTDIVTFLPSNAWELKRRV